jgi:KDO2-lipid IV(A) lauroyltransferase
MIGALARMAVEEPYYAALAAAPWASGVLRGGMARAAWLAMPAWRANLRRNAGLALGPGADAAARERCARAMMAAMQLAAAEVVQSSRATPDELRARATRFSGSEAYAALRAKRRGAILAGIHMGAFEPALAWLVHIERRVHVLYHPDASPRFERARSALRRRLGVVEHPITDGVAAWAGLQAALHADEVVVLHADRTMPGQRGASMPFLGLRDAQLPAGPVRLAASAGAPIVPTFCVRTPDGLHVIADPPIEVAPGALALREVPRHPAQRALVAAMEHRIRAQPSEWLAFMDLGGTLP